MHSVQFRPRIPERHRLLHHRDTGLFQSARPIWQPWCVAAVPKKTSSRPFAKSVLDVFYYHQGPPPLLDRFLNHKASGGVLRPRLISIFRQKPLLGCKTSRLWTVAANGGEQNSRILRLQSLWAFARYRIFRVTVNTLREYDQAPHHLQSPRRLEQGQSPQLAIG